MHSSNAGIGDGQNHRRRYGKGWGGL